MFTLQEIEVVGSASTPKSFPLITPQAFLIHNLCLRLKYKWARETGNWKPLPRESFGIPSGIAELVKETSFKERKPSVLAKRSSTTKKPTDVNASPPVPGVEETEEKCASRQKSLVASVEAKCEAKTHPDILGGERESAGLLSSRQRKAKSLVASAERQQATFKNFEAQNHPDIIEDEQEDVAQALVAQNLRHQSPLPSFPNTIDQIKEYNNRGTFGMLAAVNSNDLPGIVEGKSRATAEPDGTVNSAKIEQTDPFITSLHEELIMIGNEKSSVAGNNPEKNEKQWVKQNGVWKSKDSIKNSSENNANPGENPKYGLKITINNEESRSRGHVKAEAVPKDMEQLYSSPVTPSVLSELEKRIQLRKSARPNRSTKTPKDLDAFFTPLTTPEFLTPLTTPEFLTPLTPAKSESDDGNPEHATPDFLRTTPTGINVPSPVISELEKRLQERKSSRLRK